MLRLSLRIAGHTITLFQRALVAVILIFVLFGTGLILTLRYSVLPNIEHYHADITSAIGKAVGQTVEIEKIEADWRGIGPHLRLTNILILDKQKRTTLALERVDLVVSWMTLLTAELRLASLEIDQPDLMIKRDIHGNIQISGVALEKESSDNKFIDLLLNQNRIIVRGAHISWRDDMQSKPLLVFDDVNLLIENSWNHHRFALKGLPPAELSSQLDVRGDLYGKSVDDLNSWSGEIFTQLDYANITGWKTWLPLPHYFKQGEGGIRAWLGIEDGKIKNITADLALKNVQTRLASDLPQLEMRVLNGRMGWRDIAHGLELSLKRFSLRLLNDIELKPTDILVRLDHSQQSNHASGEIQANLVDLAEVGKLMEFLPLEREFKSQYANYAPKGKIENVRAIWQMQDDGKLRYKVKGSFTDLSVYQIGKIPGFSGLSGEVDGNENSGTLSIDSRNLTVDAPEFMPEMLAFNTISAQASWQNHSKGMELKLRNVAVTNEDIAGVAYGNYQTMPNSPGLLDLNVHLTQASLPHAWKYIPLIALDGKAKDWMKTAFLEGQSGDFNLRLKGNLNDFPFVDNKKGIFKIHARLNNAAIEYLPDWPKIEKGNAELLLQGKTLTVTASSAVTSGVQLKSVRVELPDMLSEDLRLKISGEAAGENARALEFVDVSPVQGYLDGFTDSITAKGKGRLSLNLDIPLQGEQSVKVAGSYHFTDSDVDFGPMIPVLRKINGDLQFTESGVSVKNITAEILGGPAKLVIENGEAGKMDIKLAGLANFTALHEANPQPYLKKLSGEAAWRIDIAVQNKLRKVTLNADLQGLQSDFPAPLAKQRDESIPVHIELTDSTVDKRMLTVQYGSLLNANLAQRKNLDDVWWLERGLINFGNVAHKADRKGLWVIGTLEHASLEGWKDVFGGLESQGGSPIGEVAGIDFTIQKLNGYGSLVHDLHVKGSSQNDKFSAQFSSKELNGELNWQPGSLQAHLKNLDLGLDDGSTEEKSQQDTTVSVSNLQPTDFPEMDLLVDQLNYKGRALGKLELQGRQDNNFYQLNQMRLSNSDAILSIDGKWEQLNSESSTNLNTKLELNNAGNFLGRYGFPNSVKNGSGKIEGSFAWKGAPWSYSKTDLNGSFNVDTKKGQFLQIEPGMGKLLSILSLQALPKRIVLDFDDVFSKGFEFDSIKGNAEINLGVMQTDNLKIYGTSAKVAMAGQVDLTKETQNLQVRIEPTVGNSAALVSALVATPVIGASVFLANKILGDPLGQLAAFEYNISGSWIDPKVEKVTKKKTEDAKE